MWVARVRGFPPAEQVSNWLSVNGLRIRVTALMAFGLSRHHKQYSQSTTVIPQMSCCVLCSRQQQCHAEGVAHVRHCPADVLSMNRIRESYMLVVAARRLSWMHAFCLQEGTTPAGDGTWALLHTKVGVKARRIFASGAPAVVEDAHMYVSGIRRNRRIAWTVIVSDNPDRLTHTQHVAGTHIHCLAAIVPTYCFIPKKEPGGRQSVVGKPTHVFDAQKCPCLSSSRQTAPSAY